MSDARVPVKLWLDPALYRTLANQARDQGANDVADLVGRLLDRASRRQVKLEKIEAEAQPAAVLSGPVPRGIITTEVVDTVELARAAGIPWSQLADHFGLPPKILKAALVQRRVQQHDARARL